MEEQCWKAEADDADWQHVPIPKRGRVVRNSGLGRDLMQEKADAAAPLRPIGSLAGSRVPCGRIDGRKTSKPRWDMVAAKSRRGQVVESSSKFQGPVEPDSWTVLRVWTRDVLGCKLRKTGAQSLSGQWYSSNPCNLGSVWSDRLASSTGRGAGTDSGIRVV